MQDISQTQLKRLSFIDFRLYFLGVVGRADLVTRFGIKEAAATRDLALYKKEAPNNMVYDSREKTYKPSSTFKPQFDYQAERVLSALTKGIGDESAPRETTLIPAESPSQLSTPDINTLAIITRAIHSQLPIQIEYRSLSSGFTTREIVPHCLVDNGLRWHIRAFDRRRSRFTDFVVTRITKPVTLENRTINQHELISNDIQWNRIVELEIKAHPRLGHKEVIEKDYQMVDGVMKVNLRAAVAGYLLRRWNVDCTSDASLLGDEFHLWLSNREALYGVDNLVIAPGYH